MNRKARFLIGCAALASATPLMARTFDGGTIVGLGSSNVWTTADTAVYKSGGQIDWDIYIEMDHSLLKADDDSTIRAFHRSGIGQLSSYIGTTKQPSTCYKSENYSAMHNYYLLPVGSFTWYSTAIVCSGAVCGNSPILLDIDMNGFHLSGLEPPVQFDIDADGLLDSLGWTSLNSDEAFLCVDRNHNGSIDDGTELFGSVTPLASRLRQ